MNHRYCYSVRKCTISLDKSPFCIKELMWHFLACPCKTLSLNGWFNQKLARRFLYCSEAPKDRMSYHSKLFRENPLSWDVQMDILLLAKVSLNCPMAMELGKNRSDPQSVSIRILISGQNQQIPYYTGRGKLHWLPSPLIWNTMTDSSTHLKSFAAHTEDTHHQ